MIKKNNSISFILKNKQGIAIMMVLTAITILIALLTDFTFDTKVNKFKSMNLADKAQAKINAEAGLNLAIARLRLYKEIYNSIQDNQDAKDFVSQELINKVWDFPFAFPIPVDNKMMANQKAAINEFQKNSLLQGELQVSINNISNRININMLRLPLFPNQNQLGANQQDPNNPNQPIQQQSQQQQPQTNQALGADPNNPDQQGGSVDMQIFELLAGAIRRKSDEDQLFYDKYRHLDDPMIIVSALKLYVSEKNTIEDNFTAENMSRFMDLEITPKYGIFSSDSELHLIPGLDDGLIKLIEKDITTHGSVMIDLNRITDSMLRFLIPLITDEQIKQFFTYRDDPNAPHFFNSEEDFKNYVTGIGQLMNPTDYDQRFNALKAAGIKFGSSPTLFEVISTGIFGRASVTIRATISLPPVPQPAQVNPMLPPGQNPNQNPDDEDELSPQPNDPNDPNSQLPIGQQPAPPLKLLEPRVQEIYIE